MFFLFLDTLNYTIPESICHCEDPALSPAGDVAIPFLFLLKKTTFRNVGFSFFKQKKNRQQFYCDGLLERERIKEFSLCGDL